MYDQEYEELIAQIENSLDLSLQGTAYQMIPMSLLNPEIVLPPKVFQEREGMPEVPPGRIPQPQSHTYDGAQGLVDLSWEQRAPVIEQDEIDKNPLYNKYLYQEVDDDDEEEEEMEVNKRMPDNAGDARAATPTGT